MNQKIITKALEIDPVPQALISIRELRAAIDLPSETFDRAILELADQGKVWLHRHAYPAMAKPGDTVKNGNGVHYMGIVLRT